MVETSVLWLRVAALFYSIGLIHAILTVVRRRERLFRVALWIVSAGAVLHGVSIVDQGFAKRYFPSNGIFESMSLCAFLIVAAFLGVYRRYRTESLAVFIFPLVFLMTLVAALGEPVAAWSNTAIRNTWLVVHVVSILLGYAALLFTAAAAVLYLLQERELKRKKPHAFYHRLPPLGVLDELIANSLGIGFVFITIGTVVGIIWAFIEFGTRWIGDPRINISFITWGIYLALVFFRVSAGWRGRKTAILALMAVFCCVVTWATHGPLRYKLAP